MPLGRHYVTGFRWALVLAMLGISYLAFTPIQYEIIQSVWDKAEHASAFLALAFLADYAFPESRFGLKKVLPLVGYGIFIEVVQHFLPFRYFELADVLADSVGVLIYLLVSPGFRWLPILRSR